jgi:hypothetical protein
LRYPLLAMTLVCLGALSVAATTAPSSGAASPEVACNRWNECWRVHERFENYPAFVGVVFHDDRWASHHTGLAWRWRPERRERGYYMNGIWRTF